MRRALAVLALGAAGAGGGVAVGHSQAPVRVVATTLAESHLPAWHGAEAAPLAATGSASTPVFTAGAPAPTTAAAPPPATPTATTTAPPTTTAAPPPDAVVALGVAQTEYATRLSRSSLPAGDVVVQLQDDGEDAHDLRIVRTDAPGTAVQFPTVEPGETATRTVRLPAGSYRVLCTLTAPSSHDALGMHASLVVTAR